MIFDNIHFETSGVTVFLGNTSTFVKDSDIENFAKTNNIDYYCYPETTAWLYNINKLGKDIVYNYKNNNKKSIVITNNLCLLRAIECYSDLSSIMDNLDVYEINFAHDLPDSKIKGKIYCSDNLMYSEYGISSFYGIFEKSLDDLDKELESIPM